MSYAYKDAVKIAKSRGFAFHRKAHGSHEIWKHENGQTLLISTSGSTCHRAIKNFKAEIRRKVQS
jgi:predicted RNA binding protein YcfA (HicA-like mRNA interferase family)